MLQFATAALALVSATSPDLQAPSIQSLSLANLLTEPLVDVHEDGETWVRNRHTRVCFQDGACVVHPVFGPDAAREWPGHDHGVTNIPMYVAACPPHRPRKIKRQIAEHGVKIHISDTFRQACGSNQISEQDHAILASRPGIAARQKGERGLRPDQSHNLDAD